MPSMQASLEAAAELWIKIKAHAAKRSETYEFLGWGILLLLVSLCGYFVQISAVPAGSLSMQNEAILRVLLGASQDNPLSSVNSPTSFIKWLSTSFADAAFPVEGNLRVTGTGSRRKIVEGFISTHMRVVGSMRLRQVRVRPRSCDFAEMIPYTGENCYAPLRDVDDIEMGGMQPPWQQQFASAEKLKIYDLTSKATGEMLSGGGYSLLWAPSRVGMLQAAASLFDVATNSSWFHPSTRQVTLEFNIFNGNINALSAAKIVCEFTGSGRAVCQTLSTTTSINSLISSSSSLPWVISQGAVFAVALINIFFLARYATTVSLAYFATRGWSLYDSIMNLLAFASFGFQVDTLVQFNKLAFPPLPQEYVSYDYALSDYSQYVELLAVLTVMVWGRMFKYLYYLPFTLRLYCTLSLLAPQVGVLSLVGSILTFAFALALTTMYGSQDIGFRDVSTSCKTLFGLFWPSLADPMTISKSSRYNFLVVSWVMVCVLLLWNLVIAMASVSMSAAARDASKDEATISECFDVFFQACSDNLRALKVYILKLPVVQRFLRHFDMDPVVPVNRKKEQQKSMQDRIANLSAGFDEAELGGTAAAGLRSTSGRQSEGMYHGVDWNASLVSAAQMETLEQQVIAITAALNKLTGVVATLSASAEKDQHHAEDGNQDSGSASAQVSRRKVFPYDSNDTFPVRAAPSLQDAQVIRNLPGLSSKSYQR